MRRKNDDKKYIFTKTTRDKYELPVAVADSAKELGEMLGMKQSTILACILHAEQKGYKSTYHRIEIEEDDDERV